MYGSQIFNINLVITGVVLLTILSYIMYEIINYIEKKYNIGNTLENKSPKKWKGKICLFLFAS